MEKKLRRKIEENFAEHKAKWDKMSKAEVIENAEYIVGIKAVYDYLQELFVPQKEAVNFILAQSDPLQFIASAWLERSCDYRDVHYVIRDFILDARIEAMEAAYWAEEKRLAQKSIAKKPSVLAKLKSNLTALVQPKPKAAVKHREEAR